MIRLSRDSYIMRFYAFGSPEAADNIYRNRVNLCGLFWSCLFKAIALSIVLGLVAWLVAQAVVAIITRDPMAWLPLLVIVGVGILLGAAATVSVTVECIAKSDAWQFVKGNYCPKIDIES